MFWLKSEPISEKTPTLTFSPPPQAAGRNKLKTNRLGRKKFSLGCGAKGNFLRPHRCRKIF